MITNERKRKILEEIIESKKFRTPVRENEFTRAELAKEYGLGRSQIDTLLADLLKSEKIVWREALEDGKACKAYSFVDETESFNFNS